MLSILKHGASRFWSRQAPITLAGILILTVLGSTLYDLLVKPGLSSFGQIVLSTLTLGSQTLRNSIYSAAALDPTPVSALYILLFAISAMVLPAGFMHGLSSARRRSRELDQLDPEQADAHLAQLNRRVRKLTAVFWATFVVWFGGVFIGFLLHNQSVVVWRIFQANATVLSAKLSGQEILDLRARFAAMRTRDDYLEVQSLVEQAAERVDAAIHQHDPW